MKHFFSFFFFLFCICCSAQIYVPSQYSTIQGAIDAAENGETIIVSSQITNYTGLIEINKELSIIADGDAVIIDASEQGFAVKILADNVIFSGFNIIGNESTNAGVIITPGSQNITISSNEISGMSLPNLSNDSPLSYGILVYGNGDLIDPPTDIIISENSIHNISGSGVSLGSNTSNVSILNNTIYDISAVQYMDIIASLGINAEYSENILVENNSFTNITNASNLLSSTGLVSDNDYVNVAILLSKYLDDDIAFYTNIYWVEIISDPYIFYLFQDTILGCMDILACNYNVLATDDDDSCIYVDGICETCSGETDGTGTIVDNDSDDDGICDNDEIQGCTDTGACNYDELATDYLEGSCIYPDEIYLDCNGDCLNDTDSDGLCDEVDEDIDGDGMTNDWEEEYGFDPFDFSDAFSDFDQDGLTNLEEYEYSTNPTNVDTDGDGISDFEEITNGLDPLIPNTDCDEDGIWDYEDSDDCVISIPQGFSPNGDTFNEYFVIEGLENLSPENELIVFNRWGQIVFKINNYQNDWAGTNQYSSGLFSDQLATGTYYYIFRTINAVPIIGDKEYKGYIYINR